MTSKFVSIVKLNPNEWEKYRNIKLESLRVEPKAFISTYNELKNYPLGHWKEGLSNEEERR